MNTVRTRFAPSPTGYMHIGNLRTALYAYLFAKSQNGRFVLRIEDTDQNRMVEGATQVIYDTLKTAHIGHDEGPDVGGEYGPYIQSQRKNMYKDYALQLVANGHAYYCFCQKEDTDDSLEGYNRHCRNLSKEETAARLAAGDSYVIRQRIPQEGTTGWNDLVYGEISVENNTLDDQVLLKSDGMPTYNFANVIDDHLMGITHIIRGSEYLSSNPKYILLYQAFGWEVPAYIHLPLIAGKNPDGTVSKLSKRHGAVSFQDLVADGFLPEAIINYIALLGWSPKDEREIFSMQEMEKIFSVEGIHKNPAIFDQQKLEWVNGEHIKLLPVETFKQMALLYSGVKGSFLADKWDTLAPLLQSRTRRFQQIPDLTAFLYHLAPYDTELYINKKNKSTVESSVQLLEAAVETAKTLPVWDLESIQNGYTALAEQLGIKMGPLMWPVRIALSGLLITPCGATDILYLLGRDESLRRLQYGLEKLKA